MVLREVVFFFFLTWSLNKIALSKLHSIKSILRNNNSTLHSVMNMGRKEKGDGEMKQDGEYEGNIEAWNCPDRQANTERTGRCSGNHIPSALQWGKGRVFPLATATAVGFAPLQIRRLQRPFSCSELSWTVPLRKLRPDCHSFTFYEAPSMQ